MRKVPIGLLRDDAEKNDQCLIPTCSSTVTEDEVDYLHHSCEIPDEYEIIIRPRAIFVCMSKLLGAYSKCQ